MTEPKPSIAEMETWLKESMTGEWSLSQFATLAYRAGYNAAIEAAANCYSPDDTATDWADKIKELKQ